MDLPFYIVVGVSNGTLYALMALGLVLIYKTQNFVPFVNGEFFTTGAFAAFSIYNIFALPYWAALCVAVLCGAAIGFLCERAVIRPLANSHHLSLVMVTVGASIFLQGLARMRWGDDIYTLPPIAADYTLRLAGVPIAAQNLIVVVAAIILVAALFLFFTYTTMGKQVRAVSQNLVGAQLIGINPNAVYRTTWIISGVLGAVAGMLAAPLTLLYPDMGSEVLIKGFAAAILGGLTSIPGALIGGLIIGIFEMMIAGYVSTVFLKISAFVIIMIVLLIKPEGIFGSNTMGRV